MLLFISHTCTTVPRHVWLGHRLAAPQRGGDRVHPLLRLPRPVRAVDEYPVSRNFAPKKLHRTPFSAAVQSYDGAIIPTVQ